jgi:lysophospholipase L1-like esterase
MLKQIDRRGRFHLTLVAATLALLACGSAEARRQQVSGPPPVVAPLDSALAAAPLEPNSRKHVYVITDSVMLGAKQKFIDALPGWEVTFDGRPAIQIRQALKEYTLGRRDTGPVAVVALGYNTLWEKDRHNFKRWADMFDKHVEEMLAALKERGAKRIVWVYLRELTREMITTGGVSLSQYNRYAWYFPYVNERLKAIKERHPEMAIADWASAAHIPGVTYDAIHLNGRGAELMVEVVKTAMGVYGEPSATPQTAVARAPAQAPAPSVAAVAEPPRAEPARVEPGRRVVATVMRRAEAVPPPAEPVRVEPVRIETTPARVEPPRVEETHATTPRKKPSYRGHRQEMFAMSRFESAPVVMLGDSLTERAQWGEITGCGFIANRGIGGDDSAGVLRRLDAVVRLRPGAVFMMIGVNDLISNVPSDRIVDNVRETIGRLTQSGAKVYLTLVLPVTHGFTRKINARADDLNAAYIKLAAETNATLVDFRADMQGRGGFLRDELSIDGIHLSPEGYRVWRDAVAPLVARHCSQAGDLVAQAAPPKLLARVPQSTDLAPVAHAAPPVAQPAVQPTQRLAVADVTASIPVRPAMRGAWIIQVGAYPEEEKAQERIRQAQDLGKELLANADPFTEKVVKGSRELYRARFAGFNQGAAEAACSYFKRNAIDCISMKR